MDNPENRPPSFRKALHFWARLGLISFGGPAGQIAIMHTELVEKRRWIQEERFLHALNFCMLLPGPEAQQLATYMGWLLHGLKGGVAAGVLFVLPSAILLWALSWLFLAGGSIPWIAAIFHGLQPAVMAIVAAALLRMGGKALKTPFHWALAALAFAAIFFFQVPFVFLIAGAALAGWIHGRMTPFPDEESLPSPSPLTANERRDSCLRIFQVASSCLALWALPIILAGLWQGWDSILFQEGIFFSKAALITFGGAYAVLPYVAQQAVDHYGWLTTGQMMSGLALAETTPGPLIMVLQFVGFTAAWQQANGLPPLLAGTLGAAITTWVTFLPSFLFVLAGAPHVERLRRIRSLSLALSGITAAVVGVMLNLAVWFGLHTLAPTPGYFDFPALVVALIFFWGLWKARWGVLPVIAAGSLWGLLSSLGS